MKSPTALPFELIAIINARADQELFGMLIENASSLGRPTISKNAVWNAGQDYKEANIRTKKNRNAGIGKRFFVVVSVLRNTMSESLERSLAGRLIGFYTGNDTH